MSTVARGGIADCAADYASIQNTMSEIFGG
jgi:hypothetical protein